MHEVMQVSANAMVVLILQYSHVSNQYLAHIEQTQCCVSYVSAMLGESSFHTRTCNPPAKGFAQQTLTDAAGSPVHCCWTFWGSALWVSLGPEGALRRSGRLTDQLSPLSLTTLQHHTPCHPENPSCHTTTAILTAFPSKWPVQERL